MTEDHEQDRTEERETPARPVTAAARRERRASARGETGPKRGVEDKVPAGARTRRGRAAAEADSAETALSKKAQGIATPKRDRQEKQPSPFVRLNRFVREVIAELRKVIWPTRKQQITYTLVVLVFVAVVVAFVSGLDVAFAKGVFAIFA
ncbi:MAG TPA: preprotein translocase subunit SecE [Pseudonocardiaceae bacterium]|nr:preprotein translocase subunit SecE [Pseudonocardiaceae bacterium]